MLHHIDPDAHGPYGHEMAEAVSACVHCGYCLAACPTYDLTGIESESPRGRIMLMKEVLEGNLDLEVAGPHLDQCLGCLACEPACPSGVAYHKLITPFRAITESKRKRSFLFRFKRLIAKSTLPHPKRFRVAAKSGKFAKTVSWAVPKPLKPMVELLPDHLPKQVEYDEVYPAVSETKSRVALLIGCAQSVLAPDINLATIEVLNFNGVEVVIPQQQGCCGALSWHVGDLPAAQSFARSNIRAFRNDFDAVVTNAAGCGSGMQEYGLIFRGQKDESTAQAFSARVKDVSVFLDGLGALQNLPTDLPPQRIVYQDACHLACAQGVKTQPRSLLSQLPSIDLVDLPRSELCCGSAGTYNIDQPEMADRLGIAKANAVIETGADRVASGNIGCITQLNMHLDRLGSKIRANHTMQVLRDAYRYGSE